MHILCFVGEQLFPKISTKNVIENALSKRDGISFCSLSSLVLIVPEYALKNMLKRMSTLYSFAGVSNVQKQEFFRRWSVNEPDSVYYSPGRVCETFDKPLSDFIEYWLRWWTLPQYLIKPEVFISDVRC